MRDVVEREAVAIPAIPAIRRAGIAKVAGIAGGLARSEFRLACADVAVEVGGIGPAALADYIGDDWPRVAASSDPFAEIHDAALRLRTASRANPPTPAPVETVVYVDCGACAHWQLGACDAGLVSSGPLPVAARLCASHTPRPAS